MRRLRQIRRLGLLNVAVLLLPAPSFGRPEWFEGKTGLEIGGPTRKFRRAPAIYKWARRIDNCNLPGRVEEGTAFVFNPKRAPGRHLVREATDLRGIASESYDFVASSHTLEHCANPIRALLEWRRVIRPGGHLVLILPNRDAMGDHRRPVTTLAHMIEDHEAGTTEDDETHLDEVLRLHHEPGRSREAIRRDFTDNARKRGMHHHTFILGSAVELVHHVGLEVLAGEARLPHDLMIIARKP